VPGVQPTSRAIAREPAPDAASSTIRARSRIRSSMVKAITVAWGIAFIPNTNHDSRFSESGY
jgi:hypothetical protein